MTLIPILAGVHAITKYSPQCPTLYSLFHRQDPRDKVNCYRNTQLLVIGQDPRIKFLFPVSLSNFPCPLKRIFCNNDCYDLIENGGSNDRSGDNRRKGGIH